MDFSLSYAKYTHKIAERKEKTCGITAQEFLFFLFLAHPRRGAPGMRDAWASSKIADVKHSQFCDQPGFSGVPPTVNTLREKLALGALWAGRNPSGCRCPKVARGIAAEMLHK
jgi:hypothetical protein